jgi:hypothetical protein
MPVRNIPCGKIEKKWMFGGNFVWGRGLFHVKQSEKPGFFDPSPRLR